VGQGLCSASPWPDSLPAAQQVLYEVEAAPGYGFINGSMERNEFHFAKILDWIRQHPKLSAQANDVNILQRESAELTVPNPSWPMGSEARSAG
jgi:hypothetical protein